MRANSSLLGLPVPFPELGETPLESTLLTESFVVNSVDLVAPPAAVAAPTEVAIAPLDLVRGSAVSSASSFAAPVETASRIERTVESAPAAQANAGPAPTRSGVSGATAARATSTAPATAAPARATAAGPVPTRHAVASAPVLQLRHSDDALGLNAFTTDARFADIDGSGFATAILDTGIDLDHAFFGPDSDNDGIADRIVYQYDFADGDSDASDRDNHGSNVTGIIASSDATYTGVAPGADIIHLKVFPDSGAARWSDIEDALRWVANNASTYNIASVNMSLADAGNYSYNRTFTLSNEIADITALDIPVVVAAGNDFYTHGSAQGVAYPAADVGAWAIGATFDHNIGSITYGSGAKARSSDRDRIAPFSQRDADLTTVFAPGAAVTSANKRGGTVTMHGTSQAAPQVAGMVLLAQELAQRELGRTLSLAELEDLLVSTATPINDGDDEDDNVINTGLDFPLANMQALGEAIYALGSPESEPIVMGEFGELTVDEKITTVSLQNTYANPVAFVAPISRNGGDTVVARFDRISADSFGTFLQETSDQNGKHVDETASWFVFEEGSWELSDGTLIEVGTIDTDQMARHGFESVTFATDFETTPAVITQVQTVNDLAFVGTRTRNPSATGFEVALEEEERTNWGSHGTETVGYVAIAPGTGTWSGNPYEAGITGYHIDERVSTIAFEPGVFGSAPQFLAGLGYRKPDPVVLRRKGISATGADVFAQEDLSSDSEVGHALERASFLAIEGSGSLSALAV